MPAMFLGQMEKPDVESIEGLSPAISIDQKSTNRNPRSTVGTVTEIYDYFRLLYARIGITSLSFRVAERLSKQTVDQMVDQIMASAGANQDPAAGSGGTWTKRASMYKVLEQARKKWLCPCQ